MGGRGREKMERVLSRLSAESRAQQRTRSHNPEVMTWADNQESDAPPTVPPRYPHSFFISRSLMLWSLTLATVLAYSIYNKSVPYFTKGHSNISTKFSPPQRNSHSSLRGAWVNSNNVLTKTEMIHKKFIKQEHILVNSHEPIPFHNTQLTRHKPPELS